MRCFCEDLDATKTSKILQINRNTINRYFNIFREIIFYQETGEFELDERSYFRTKRIRGKNYWKAYEKFVPKDRYVQSKAHNYIVEGYNSLLSHFLAKMRRKE